MSPTHVNQRKAEAALSDQAGYTLYKETRQL